MSVFSQKFPGWEDFPNGLRVLVVDEDAAGLGEIKRMLEDCHYVVSLFTNGEEALLALRQERFHAALVEATLAQAFELLGGAPHLPVMLMSNTENIGLMMQGIRDGAAEFIQKPLSEEKMRNVWQHVIRKAHQNGCNPVLEGFAPGPNASLSPGASSSGVELEPLSGSNEDDMAARNVVMSYLAGADAVAGGRVHGSDSLGATTHLEQAGRMNAHGESTTPSADADGMFDALLNPIPFELGESCPEIKEELLDSYKFSPSEKISESGTGGEIGESGIGEEIGESGLGEEMGESGIGEEMGESIIGEEESELLDFVATGIPEDEMRGAALLHQEANPAAGDAPLVVNRAAEPLTSSEMNCKIEETFLGQNTAMPEDDCLEQISAMPEDHCLDQALAMPEDDCLDQALAMPEDDCLDQALAMPEDNCHNPPLVKQEYDCLDHAVAMSEENVPNATSAKQEDSPNQTLVKSEDIVNQASALAITPANPEENSGRSSTERGNRGNKSSTPKRKVKVDWTPDLHRRFVQAVEQLGVEKAIPSRILELMGVHTLTRHNIASHLQKYRCHRRHLLAREHEAAMWNQQQHKADPLLYMRTRRDGAWGHGGHSNPPRIQPRPPLVTPGPPAALTYASMHPHARPMMPTVWGPSAVDPSHMWPQPMTAAPWQAMDNAWSYQCPDIWGHPSPGMGGPCFTPPYRYPFLSVQAGYSPDGCFYADESIPAIHMYPSGAEDPELTVAADVAANSKPSDFQPPKEILDAAISEALANPDMPLPLGLKPPSMDQVMAALKRQGIKTLPS